MFWLFGIFALSAEFLKRKPEDYLSLYFFNLKKYAFNLCYFWLFNLIIYLFNYLHHHFLLSYVTHQTYCSTAKASLLTYLCYFLSKSKAATKIFFWAENLITPSFVRSFSARHLEMLLRLGSCRPGHPLSLCTPGSTLGTAQPPSSFLSSLLYLTVTAAVRAEPLPYLLRDLAWPQPPC